MNGTITFPAPTANWGAVTGVVILAPRVTETMRDWLWRINNGLKITTQFAIRDRMLTGRNRLEMRERDGRLATRYTIARPLLRRMLDRGLVVFETNADGLQELTLTPAGKREAR